MGRGGHRFFLLALIHPPVNLIHDYRDAVDLLQFGVGVTDFFVSFGSAAANGYPV